MIYYLVLILAVNIIDNYFHKAVITQRSARWHGLDAMNDAVTFGGFLFLIYKDYLKVYGIIDVIMLLGIFLFVRLVSRDIMLGIGTTSWMDRNIKGFYRLALYLFCIFWTFAYIYHYFKYY